MIVKAIHGIVLAGGKSARFGSDKALVVFEGKPLIGYAVDLLRSAGLPVCVVTQLDRDYSFLQCPVIFDREPHRGPLAGLDRAFEEFPEDRILALTCDMPFLVKEDLERLLNQEHGAHDIVLYRLETDRFQPFPGIYDSSLRNKDIFKDKTISSIQSFIKKINRVFEIDVVISQEHFRNINRRSDLFSG